MECEDCIWFISCSPSNHEITNNVCFDFESGNNFEMNGDGWLDENWIEMSYNRYLEKENNCRLQLSEWDEFVNEFKYF